MPTIAIRQASEADEARRIGPGRRGRGRPSAKVTVQPAGTMVVTVKAQGLPLSLDR